MNLPTDRNRRPTFRTRQTSVVADAYRKLRSGVLQVDELEQCARVIADAEGHGDPVRVLVRELGPDCC